MSEMEPIAAPAPEKDRALPAQTTFQEDLTLASQRGINLIWETTQSQIARYVVIGTLAANTLIVLLSMMMSRDLTAAQALGLGFINSICTGVTSFYFSRTNHAAIGGIGAKPIEKYSGR